MASVQSNSLSTNLYANFVSRITCKNERIVNEIRCNSQQVLKYHFAILNINDLPIESSSCVSTFVERYYDFDDFILMKLGIWLKERNGNYSLKIIEKVKIDDSKNFLSYNEINEIKSIKKIISAFHPFSKLNCYASFMVVRYEWENGLLVDLCNFGDMGYYVLGTLNSKKTLNLDIDINTNINPKIVQYCLFNKIIQNNNIDIAEIRALDISINTSLYKQFPDFPTPNYLKKKFKKAEKQHKKDLKQIPAHIRENHPNKYALIYSIAGNTSLSIFDSYRSAKNFTSFKIDDNAKIIFIPGEIETDMISIEI